MFVLTHSSPHYTCSFPPLLTMTCRPAAVPLPVMNDVYGWLPVLGTQINYSIRTGRPCTTPSSITRRGRQGLAPPLPLSFLPSHPPCIKLRRGKGEGTFTISCPLLYAVPLPFPVALPSNHMYLVCVARLMVPHSHTSQERNGWRAASPEPETGSVPQIRVGRPACWEWPSLSEEFFMRRGFLRGLS